MQCLGKSDCSPAQRKSFIRRTKPYSTSCCYCNQIIYFLRRCADLFVSFSNSQQTFFFRLQENRDKTQKKRMNGTPIICYALNYTQINRSNKTVLCLNLTRWSIWCWNENRKLKYTIMNRMGI